jgi:hypothetical protein
MSIKKTLFRALQKELKSKIPTLAWIDKNMGQLNNLDDFEVFPLPAILIEFGRTDWQGLGDGVQQGISMVKLHIIFENYSSANSETTEKEMNTALAFFDFTDQVHEVVEGFGGDGWSPLSRIGEDEDNNHRNFITTVTEYQTMLQDYSGQRRYKEIPVDIDVKPVHKRPFGKPASTIISDFIPSP